MRYDLTTLTVRPGTTPVALPRLKNWLEQGALGGRLVACWFTELGALNQILLIREYADDSRIAIDRDAIVRSANPFGISDLVISTTSDTYASFPFVPPMQPSEAGPVFEVRSYILKPDGLEKTMALWEAAVPKRIKLSPLLAAVYSLSGVSPRFVHIWPYASLDRRQAIRAEAVKAGVWPPPGGPDQLLSQQADIYFAAPFSPIR